MQPKNRIPIRAAIFMLLLAWSVPSFAQTPRTLSYQGVLKSTDPAGNILAGNRLLTVTLYSDANGTQRLWQQAMNITLDSSGVFNTLLGSADNPLPDAQTMDRPIWLGLSVDNGPELRPLSQLSASPFALNVADNAVTNSKIADGSITSTKLADSSITASKLAMNYISSISVNGEPVTGNGTPLNITGGDGVKVLFDPVSNSIFLNNSGTTSDQGKGGTTAQQEEPGTTARWSEIGNRNIAVPGQFVGTTDSSSALEFHLENNRGGDLVRVARYQFENFSPNITMGYGAGSLTGNIIGNDWTSTQYFGNTIAGGGDTDGVNTINGDFSFIGSGLSNTITSNHALITSAAAIVAGSGNKIDTAGGFIGAGENNILSSLNGGIISGFENSDSGSRTVIGGGGQNVATRSGSASFIGAGDSNWVDKPGDFVGSALRDTIDAYESGSIVGEYNRIDSNSEYSLIGAGSYNRIYTASVNSFIGGGTVNIIDTSSPYSVVGGGDNNTIAQESDHTVISGGRANLITGPLSVVAGGDNNAAFATRDFIGGGHANIISDSLSAIVGGDSNSVLSPWGFVGGGKLNTAGQLAEDSLTVVVGGDSNWAEEEFSAIVGGQGNKSKGTFGFIGGGFQNLIADENFFFTAFSTIGGGFRNRTTALFNSITGGDSNIVQTGANYGTIGGGLNNLVDTADSFAVVSGGRGNHIEPNGGFAAAIPGGDSLLANSYAQTVVGFNNIETGTITKATSAAGTSGLDTALFIVGNGKDAAHPSDAFTVSYDGHSTVTDRLTTARIFTEGSTYNDNIIVAWGEIPGSGGAVYPFNYPTPIANSFGVLSVTEVIKGQFKIVLQANTPGGSSYNFSTAAITVTPEDAGAASPSCLIATSTKMGVANNTFTIHIQDLGCNPQDNGFMFQVVAR